MISDPREHVWAAITYRVANVEKRVSMLEGIVSLGSPSSNPRAATISKDLGGLCSKYKVAYDELVSRAKGENLDTIRHNIITDLANMGGRRRPWRKPSRDTPATYRSGGR